MTTDVLATVETYYDAAPRPAASVVEVEVGPFTLFVDTVFLGARDGSVARIYERVGFVRVGTACIAEPSAPTAAPAG